MMPSENQTTGALKIVFDTCRDYPGEVGTESELLHFISKEMNYIELHEIIQAVQGIRGFGKLCRMIEAEFDDEIS